MKNGFCTKRTKNLVRHFVAYKSEGDVMERFQMMKLDEFIEACERVGISVSKKLRSYRGKGYFIGREFRDNDSYLSLGMPVEKIGPAMRWAYLFDPGEWVEAVVELSEETHEYDFSNRRYKNVLS